MSKYKHLKLKLKDVSVEDRFLVNIIHYTDSQAFDFEFGNSTYWIERGLLNFYEKDKEVKPVEFMLINPRNWEKETHRISVNKPFVYTVKGEIIDNGDKVLLKMKAISYLFEKNKTYFLKFKSVRATNELEITF